MVNNRIIAKDTYWLNIVKVANLARCYLIAFSCMEQVTSQRRYKEI